MKQPCDNNLNQEMTELSENVEDASDEETTNNNMFQPAQDHSPAGSQPGNSSGEDSQEGNLRDDTAPMNPFPDNNMQPPETPKDNDSKNVSRCPSMLLKVILTCTSVLAVIFFISTTVLATKRTQSNSPSNLCLQSDPPCQDDWIWYRGRCYYFSKNDEEKNWNASKSFCSDHNATLVVFESGDIKDFIIRFKCSDNYWIGLEKKGQSWTWLNGNATAETVIGNGGNCAFLTSVTHFEASSSRCSTPHRWICSKPDALQNPKSS